MTELYADEKIECPMCEKQAKFSEDDRQYYCKDCGWWMCV